MWLLKHHAEMPIEMNKNSASVLLRFARKFKRGLNVGSFHQIALGDFMSMTMCSNCGKLTDTDYDNGEFVGDDDYICEDCICVLSDEDLEDWGITR
jgi:hypothetical protein